MKVCCAAPTSSQCLFEPQQWNRLSYHQYQILRGRPQFQTGLSVPAENHSPVPPLVILSALQLGTAYPK